jgi:transmembrane sensor
MKAKLRLPLRSTIRDGFDEGDVMRLWRGLQARRSRRWVGWRLAVGVAAASALALWLIVPWSTVINRTGPLRLATGGVPTALVAGQQPERLVLADGSSMTAGPHSKVDVLANDARLFLSALRQGAVRIAVQPGGPRRWVVDCGPVSIEVVGTEFEVERAASEIVVSVMRGVVVVRGARVPDHVQRVSAGQRLAIPTAEAPLPEVAPGLHEPTIAPIPSESPAQPAPVLAPSEPSPAVPAARLGPDDMIRRADAARRAGDAALAKRLLAQAIEMAAGSPSGAVAALTLARLSMGEDPAGAAAVLAKALRNRVPRGLEEDVRARLVEARVRSGDKEGARAAAREYHRRFPQGVHGPEVRRWVAE